jgi:CheY-like chemotaxis protein
VVSSVLVVDDDPAFLALAARILEGLGVAHISTAPDAATAVTQADARRPQAALVDVGLPDRGGIDLARELATRPWSPRVVLTSTDRDAANAMETEDGRPRIPFLPKEELANGTLRKLLLEE